MVSFVRITGYYNSNVILVVVHETFCLVFNQSVRALSLRRLHSPWTAQHAAKPPLDLTAKPECNRQHHFDRRGTAAIEKRRQNPSHIQHQGEKDAPSCNHRYCG